MSRLIGKRIKSQTYYYLREVARVGGKPKIVSQRYLGKAAHIEAAMDGAAALPQRTGIWPSVTWRRSGRCCSAWAWPRSSTRWWGRVARTCRRRSVAAVMIERYGLDLSGLVLDMTNFATFIDTGNEKAPIAQRGKAKQKRTDLRLIGLALVITRDGGIPVLSHAYPGNRPDVTQFATVIATLTERYRQPAGGLDALTLTFDAGNDSAANQDRLAGTGLHYVGSLVVSQHPDLLAVNARRFTASFQYLHQFYCNK